MSEPTHIPQKIIKTLQQVEIYQHSEAYRRLMLFLVKVNDAITGKTLSTKLETYNPCLDQVICAIDELTELTAKFPPVAMGQRYGNPSYRQWHAEMEKIAPKLIEATLLDTDKNNVSALVPYFTDSFGNGTRIDYGTGHETAFISFLVALNEIHHFTTADYLAFGLKVFPKYLMFVRKLQMEYRMEPAGSQGVWGLDDYQFLAFLWGSAQLIGSTIQPKDILNRDLVKQYASEYMFFDAIAYVNLMKTGPFNEHSPILYSAATDASKWEKVNYGLFRLYRKDVLMKLPVVQHFFFGKFLPFIPSTQSEADVMSSLAQTNSTVPTALAVSSAPAYTTAAANPFSTSSQVYMKSTIPHPGLPQARMHMPTQPTPSAPTVRPPTKQASPSPPPKPADQPPAQQ